MDLRIPTTLRNLLFLSALLVSCISVHVIYETFLIYPEGYSSVMRPTLRKTYRTTCVYFSMSW
jgi:hypothetical protein